MKATVASYKIINLLIA